MVGINPGITYKLFMAWTSLWIILYENQALVNIWTEESLKYMLELKPNAELLYAAD